MNDRDQAVVDEEVRAASREEENARNNREAADYVCLQNLAAVVAMWPSIDLLMLQAAQHAPHNRNRQGRIYAACHKVEAGIDALRDILKEGG